MSYELPKIVKCAERVMAEIEIAVTRFPRAHRYTLGSDLRQQSMAVARLAHKAWRDRDQQTERIEQLSEAIDDLKLRMQLGQQVRAFVAPDQRRAHKGEAGMSEPRCRPVIFSTPMVRAILTGRKTQTRRVVQKLLGATAVEDVYHRPDGCFIGLHLPAGAGCGITEPFPCPYGARGDELWVRERWRVSKQWDAALPRTIPPRDMTVIFSAGGSIANDHDGRWVPDETYPQALPDWAGKLRPAIFLPRWASRITLRITDVHVERLQAITPADAIAEGCSPVSLNSLDCDSRSPVMEYRGIWERINGDGSWQQNPFVWVITFERIK
jgi:hypothetical protein